jgi:hypothetical protein
MAKNYDLVGKRFERLLVVCLKMKGKSKYWNCVCDCGNITVVTTSHLISGHTVSCGCRSKENRDKRNFKHGLCLKSRRLYRIFHAMKLRCFDKKHRNYSDYGERGITVCSEWENNIESFFEWALANGYDDTKSIDRIDNDKGYSPDNCRWATNAEQARNKRDNVYLTINGEKHVLSDWARIKSIDRSTLANRIKKGWDIDKALNTPARNKKACSL